MTTAITDAILRDIAPGLVLHLQPDVLMAKGGRFVADREQRIMGRHYFVCLAVENGTGTWAPATTKDGPGHVPLDKAGATGMPTWVNTPSYLSMDGMLTAPHEAVAVAALAGHDLSKPGRRNRISPKRLPAPYQRRTWDVGCFVTVRVAAGSEQEARETALLANGWPTAWTDAVEVGAECEGRVIRARNLAADALMVREVESDD
jgi:hypothetical protein